MIPLYLSVAAAITALGTGYMFVSCLSFGFKSNLGILFVCALASHILIILAMVELGIGV